MIRCNECHKLSHLKCAGKNAKMKTFLCATCQLILMDPFQVPVVTLIAPYIVYKYSNINEDEMQPSFPAGATKVCDFNE